MKQLFIRACWGIGGLLVLLLSGCAGRSVAQRERPAAHSGAEAGMEGAGARRLAAVRANYGRVEDLSGLINVTVEEAGESEHLGGTVLFRRPDLLRLEIMTPLGQAVATIVHREGVVLVHDHRAGRWWRTRADDRGMVRFYDLRFSVLDWMTALRDGGVPADSLPLAEVSWDGAVCRFPRGDSLVELELDAERPVVRERRVVRAGELIERISYSRFRRQGGVEQANRIDALWPLEERRLTIRFRKKAINSGVNLDRFTLELPPGVVAEEM